MRELPVVVGPRAEQQLRDAYNWYHQRSPEAAAKWYNGFIDALNSLRLQADRHGFAHENPSFPIPVRELLYGRKRNWRALYTIRPEMVYVFSIRHAAQKDVTPDEY
jgi:plasmid stabilization system protein ParE